METQDQKPKIIKASVTEEKGYLFLKYSVQDDLDSEGKLFNYSIRLDDVPYLISNKTKELVEEAKNKVNS